MSVPKRGGAVTVLATGQSLVYGVAVDEHYVYWANNARGTIARVPKAGGGISLVASGQGGPYEVAEDSSALYWTNNRTGEVMRLVK